MRNSSRSSVVVAIASALAISAAAGSRVSAHRLDEYLQAARIDLHIDRVGVELDLTPGVALARSIVAMIDSDRDGKLSAGEQRRYAGGVLSAVQLTVDGTPVLLSPASWTFPDQHAFDRGEGTIRLRAEASHRGLPAGAHQLTFRNAHLAGPSVYLANALAPADDRVSVTRQRRNRSQSELTIDYSIQRASANAFPGWLGVGLVAAGAVVLLNKYKQRTSEM